MITVKILLHKDMDVFTTGLIVLFAGTAIFYIVLFSFIFYWHLRKVTVVIVPIIFAFEFFVISFLVICITALILYYLPILVNILGL